MNRPASLLLAALPDPSEPIKTAASLGASLRRANQLPPPMKNIRRLFLASFALLATAAALAAKPIPGPKGGRMLTTEAPHAEFFVQPDRTVLISFYGQDLTPAPAAGRIVTATAETKAGKVGLGFAEKDGALVSTSRLPEGDDYTVVVQIREAARAKPKNYRVLFHDEVCGECKRAEYACICDDTAAEGGPKH